MELANFASCSMASSSQTFIFWPVMSFPQFIFRWYRTTFLYSLGPTFWSILKLFSQRLCNLPEGTSQLTMLSFVRSAGFANRALRAPRGYCEKCGPLPSKLGRPEALPLRTYRRTFATNSSLYLFRDPLASSYPRTVGSYVSLKKTLRQLAAMVESLRRYICPFPRLSLCSTEDWTATSTVYTTPKTVATLRRCEA